MAGRWIVVPTVGLAVVCASTRDLLPSAIEPPQLHTIDEHQGTAEPISALSLAQAAPPTQTVTPQPGVMTLAPLDPIVTISGPEARSS